MPGEGLEPSRPYGAGGFKPRPERPADAVVVPISCNDAIDRGPLAAVLEPKTRIGSPFVISGVEAALANGRLQEHRAWWHEYWSRAGLIKGLGAIRKTVKPAEPSPLPTDSGKPLIPDQPTGTTP